MKEGFQIFLTILMIVSIVMMVSVIYYVTENSYAEKEDSKFTFAKNPSGTNITFKNNLDDYYDSYSRQYFTFYCSKTGNNESEIFVKIETNETVLFDDNYDKFCDTFVRTSEVT